MDTEDLPTPAPLLALAYDGWEVIGPLTHPWTPGRRYHATSPDGRTRLNAASYAEGIPFSYQLVSTTPAETWGLLASTVAPGAITAAARAALSRSECAAVTKILPAAGWRATLVAGACGFTRETTYAAPDQVTRAHLITQHRPDTPGSGYWLIEHAHSHEPAMADAAIPAPVLSAFLLTLAAA